MVGMVSYADVQRIYRAEKVSAGLQKIDEGFYRDACRLLSAVELEHQAHVRKMVYEIFERRRNKIVLSVLRNQERFPDNITSEERLFFEELAGVLSSYRDRVFSEKEPVSSRSKSYTTSNPAVSDVVKMRVRFLSSLPAIIGVDLVHYGPFKEGDVVDLPAENARILLDKDIVEEV